MDCTTRKLPMYLVGLFMLLLWCIMAIHLYKTYKNTKEVLSGTYTADYTITDESRKYGYVIDSFSLSLHNDRTCTLIVSYDQDEADAWQQSVRSGIVEMDKEPPAQYYTSFHQGFQSITFDAEFRYDPNKKEITVDSTAKDSVGVPSFSLTLKPSDKNTLTVTDTYFPMNYRAYWWPFADEKMVFPQTFVKVEEPPQE